MNMEDKCLDLYLLGQCHGDVWTFTVSVITSLDPFTAKDPFTEFTAHNYPDDRRRVAAGAKTWLEHWAAQDGGRVENWTPLFEDWSQPTSTGWDPLAVAARIMR